MFRSLLYLTLAASGLAVPVEERAAGPSVQIRNGTVNGKSSRGIDAFTGIPFAQPPLGDLRLRQPQPLLTGFPGGVNTFDATGSGPSCPQFILTTVPNLTVTLPPIPLLTPAEGSQEDCLTINVQRPAGTTSNSKLPVAFFIFGGGFVVGSNGMYDGANFVRSSVNLNKPVIYVAVNYRVGGFGFLAGSQLSAERNTNLGLRDQRLGLEWVAENIAAFGGDPDKVTIWGVSAGAISVCDQTIINNGDNTYNGKPLFRGAIMNSGSIIPATDTRSGKPQNVYDTVVGNSLCAGAADSLACLRSLPYADFLNAVNSVPGLFSYRSLDLGYIPRPDPSDSFFSQSPDVAVMNGQFAKVPVIVGDQEDEGTLFSLVQFNVTNNDQLVEYFASYFPENPNAFQDISTLAAQYPDRPLAGQPAGSPFRTGPLNSIQPQFKRIAAILGDITFTLTRRAYLDFATKNGVTAWSYLTTFGFGTPILGTAHGLDLIPAFFTPSNATVPARAFHTYYVNFVNELSPNSADNVGPLIDWPEWTNATTRLINIELASISPLVDHFRSNAYDFLRSRVDRFRI